MLPGQIYSQGGKVLEFQIEKAHRSGAVTAYDPSNGERFSGRYVGILERVSGTSTTMAHVGTSSGASASGVGFGSSSVGSNIANATAFLTGDKGNTLNCEMKIEAGFSPHGLGVCTDQKGAQYRLQF
jgi:hypothetical protein